MRRALTEGDSQLTINDAIAYIEDQFKCEDGAMWRWADLAMTKPYQTVTCELDLPSAHTPEDVVHRLVSRLIVAIDRLKKDAGFRREQKPKLFWRWKDKVRVEDSVIYARFYIDGNPGLMSGNPSKPRGRPTVGQIKVAA